MHQITEAKSAEYDENCIVKSVVMRKNPVIYTVQIEDDPKGKTPVLHKSLLLLSDSLLDHFDRDLNL